MKFKNLKLVLVSLTCLSFLSSCETLGVSTNQSSDGSNNQSSNNSNNSNNTTNTTVDKENFTIFALNDIHGHIDNEPSYKGAAELLKEITEDKDYDENSLILASGDLYQGTGLSNISRGKTMADVLSYFPIVSATVGNHEFDWGLEALKELTSYAKYPTLGCNVFNKDGTKAEYLDNYTVVETANTKVGIIGAIDQLENSISQVSLAGTYFDTNVSIIQDQIDELQNLGCDPIVLSVHGNGESDYVSNIVNSTEGIDGIFAAHSHQFQNIENYNKPSIVQGGANSNGYCKITFTYDGNEYLPINTSIYYVDIFEENDHDYKDLNKDLVDYINSIDRSFLEEIIGYTDEPIYKSYSNFSLYKLTLYAMYETYLKLHPEDKDENIVIVHNIGGLRANIDQGDITYNDIYQVFPFDNRVVTVDNIPYYVAETQANKSSNIGMIKVNDYSKPCKVLTIDYLTTNPNYPDIYDPNNGGKDIKPDGTSYYIRDLLVDYIRDDQNGIINQQYFDDRYYL